MHVHNQQEVAKPHLQTDFPEADLAIPVHVFDSIKSGHRKILTVTNDTDITVELLYYLTFFKQHGLEELWILAGRGESSSRYVPLHLLHSRMGPALCSVLPALYTLTGCDSTSKIGTKKAALESNAEALLSEFGKSPILSPSVLENAEKFLVNVIKKKSLSTNFTDLRKEMYHSSMSTSHLNLIPTTQGLQPHIERAYYNTYVITHLLNTECEDISPTDYGYKLTNGLLTPAKNWRKVEAKWLVTCKCLECARNTCPCRAASVKCVQFCGCKSNVTCKNQNV